MSRLDQSVWVKPIAGEPFCFHVESWSDPDHPHRVELLANDGFGECSCRNWISRKWPKIRDHEIPVRGTRATDCRHVEAARNQTNDRLYADLAKHHTQPLSYEIPR